MVELVQSLEGVTLLLWGAALVVMGFIEGLGIPAPVGMLGVWRWSVWLFRRGIGSFYRPMPVVPEFKPAASVITPVYNEDPDLFLKALRSWLQSKPLEIIAVIDHSDQRCMAVFRSFAEECAATGHTKARMLITSKSGKRPALVDGMLAAEGEIFCLVDSDTIWAADNLPKIVAPFVDPRVGGVTTRQNVLAPNSTAQRLFDVYLDIRYIDEIRFLTAFGDAVTCLSGRTAVYRRAAALPALDGLLDERFLGKRVISGDDKALTLLVQAAGWQVRYQETAQVYTPGATEMRVFLKQRLRWARNSWRADLKALFSRWVWRKPLLAFHLIDRLLQPLTTLVAPLYIIAAAYHGHWLAIAVVVSWWFLSRAIKILPHLRRHWSNIQILPWYIFFNYWSAVLKIYAFFTMNQQGWITRWNQSRMSLAGPLRLVPGYLATTSTVSVLAILVFLRTLDKDAAVLPVVPPSMPVIVASELPSALVPVAVPADLPATVPVTEPNEQKPFAYVKGQPAKLAIAPQLTLIEEATPSLIGVKNLVNRLDNSPLLTHSPGVDGVAVAQVVTQPPAMAPGSTVRDGASVVELGPNPTPTFSGALAGRPLLPVIVPPVYEVNARTTWTTAAASLMLLPRGTALLAVGRSADNEWIQVILPDQRLAWVFRETMQIDPATIQPLYVVPAFYYGV